jgi:hypothetical protein
MFNSNGYDVVITYTADPTFFRGVLDKVWLRNAPQLISSLYGGQSEAPWSMVGIVTHLPGTHVSQLGQQKPQLDTLASTQDTNNPMMLDAYRNMFRSSRAFERMFLESNTDIEVVVSPLAIYREFHIQVKNKNQD